MKTNSPRPTFVRCCNECGENFRTIKVEAEFCAPKCRMAFHNRRRDRGAELYDLVMEMRFNRKDASEKQLWTHICALAGAYRDSDKVKRSARKSWDPDAQNRLPLAYGGGGDNR